MTDCRKRSNRTTVLSGDPKGDSDPYRGLMRDDQDQIANLHVLKAAVQVGLASGISSQSLREIWAEAGKHYWSKLR